MPNSDSDWEKWGKIDPYYAVFSHNAFRAAHVNDNINQFFETGEGYVQQRIARYEKHFGPLTKGRALDFGCGVGRLVIPLAARFNEAVGVDISDSMLIEAKKNAQIQGIANAAFVKSDDELSQAQGPFDFVLSYIVLQHIPLNRGVAIIDQLLDRVVLGGGASLHFSIWRNDSLIKTAAYWIRRHIPGIHSLINILRRGPIGQPLMQMNEYPLHIILDMLQRRGFEDVLVDVERHGNVLTSTIMSRRTVMADRSLTTVHN